MSEPDDRRHWHRESGFTRRNLLKRAGTLGVTISLGASIGLGRRFGADATSKPGLPYLPGFNDDFLAYSGSSHAKSTLEKVKFCGGQCVRFGVDWGQVQANGPESYDWTTSDALFGQALGASVQLLPVVSGCPEWAEPVVTAPKWKDNDPPYPSDGYRTCSPKFDPAFAEFVDSTIRHFDFFSRDHGFPTVISAVEILNEPNIWTFGSVPARRLHQLAAASAKRVALSQEAGAFSGPMRVISGGLAPVAGIAPGNARGLPPRPSWQRYLSDLVGSGQAGYDIGLHSYETAKPPEGTLTIPEDNPSDPFARARQFANWQASRILARFDEASTITHTSIWLTETGASSASIWANDIFSAGYRAVHGASIQAEVLSLVAEGLKARPCRSMFVHRLFSDDLAEPAPTSGKDSSHHQDGIYEGIDGDPKVAPFVLSDRWT